MLTRFTAALAALFTAILFSVPAHAGLTGKVLGEAGFNEQVQQAGDELYNAATAAAIGASEVQSSKLPYRPDGPSVPRPLRSRGADAARGISGALGDLVLNSGEITCSLWLIQLRTHMRNLTIELSQLGVDNPENARLTELLRKTENFANILERECTKVGWLTSPPAEEWTLKNRIKNALGMGGVPVPPPAAPTEAPTPPEIPEGWTVADIHCRNTCGSLFELFSNANAESRNKQTEAENLAKGELADKQKRERQAQTNLDETKGRKPLNETHVRRDERQLQEAQAATQGVQRRVDRLRAESAAKAAQANSLLQQLKECLKNCRKTVKDMSGEDAAQIEGHFMNQLPDDARRTYNTLPNAAPPRTPVRTATPGGAKNKGSYDDKKTKGVLKDGAHPVKKDGDKPVKQNADGDRAPKEGEKQSLPDKTPPAAGGQQGGAALLPGFTQGADGRPTVPDGQLRDITTSCAPCQKLAQQYSSRLRNLQGVEDKIKSLEAEKAREVRNMLNRYQTTQGSDLNTTSNMMSNISFVEGMYDQAIAVAQRFRERDMAALNQLAESIAACEQRYCAGTQGLTGIQIGGGGGAPVVELPFTWAGPYRTRCFDCEKLAAELNRVPQVAYDTLDLIARYEESAEYWQTMLEMARSNPIATSFIHTESDGLGHRDPTILTPEKAEQELKESQEAINRERQNLATIAQHFARTLAMFNDCEEKRCRGRDKEKKKDEIQVPGGGSAVQPVRTLPFNWAGPYRAKCKHCGTIATELNAAKENADRVQADIARREGDLAHWQAMLEVSKTSKDGYAPNSRDTRDGRLLNYNRRDIETTITEIETALTAARAELQQITNGFNAALTRFNDCEKKRCDPVDGQKKAIKVPGGKFKIEVEGVNKVTGTNPFNSKDVEDAGLNGNDGDAIAVTPPVVTQPPVTEPVKQPPVKEPPVKQPIKEPIAVHPPVTEPVDEPWQISLSGSFSFAHTVGSSPCPQPAGTATVHSSNGHQLTLTNISVSGSISSKLDVTASNGPNPTLTGRFNCSSPANGTFSGTVSATVTDTVTGDSKSVSFSASGTVKN